MIDYNRCSTTIKMNMSGLLANLTRTYLPATTKLELEQRRATLKRVHDNNPKSEAISHTN